MKKVALINPGKDQRFAIQEPLNLGFIASYLEKNNIDVCIIDGLAGQNVYREITKYCPDIVGITATTPFVLDAYRIAKGCREKGILTVMGGVHATILPEEALQHVDIVVKGEGEQAMLDIIREDITSGIVSKPYIDDIDEIPPPARHLMQMKFYLRTKDRLPDTYLYFVPLHVRTAALLTSRGCPYNCIFCHNLWRNMPYRFNSPERVVSEIKNLVDNYGVKALFFIEDNLFINRKRLIAICNLIKQRKINIMWGGNARVDNIDLEILEIVKEAGCRQITFGFESGSQRILDVLVKQTTVIQNQTAIELCHQIGIIPQGTFMIGNPTETIEDIRMTRSFIESNKLESIGISIATPFPGTKLWEWCQNSDRLPQTLQWSDFTYDRVPIAVCDISTEQLIMLKNELEHIVFLKKVESLKFTEILMICLFQPIKVITLMKKLIKRPSSLLVFIRRIKFMKLLLLCWLRVKHLIFIFREKGLRYTFNYVYFHMLYGTKNPFLINLLYWLESYPSFIEVEVTTRCNLKCVFCEHTYWHEPNKDMSFEQFKYIVDQFPKLKWIGLTGIGESLLNSDFISMLKYVKSKNILVELYDTFYFIDKNIDRDLIELKIDKIFVSMDAATKETYEKIRVGSCFERVVNNVKNFIVLRKEKKVYFPELAFHYIISRENFKEIPQYIELVHSLAMGEKVTIQFTRMLHNFKEVDNLFIEIPKDIIVSAKEKARTLGMKITWNADTSSIKPVMSKCTEWIMPFIFVTGHVIPCCSGNEAGCRDFQRQTAMGNIFEQSFKEIWYGEKYKALRKNLHRGKPLLSCKECCLYTSK